MRIFAVSAASAFAACWACSAAVFASAVLAYSGYGANKYSHAFSQEFFNEWNSYNKNDTVYDAALTHASAAASGEEALTLFTFAPSLTTSL